MGGHSNFGRGGTSNFGWQQIHSNFVRHETSNFGWQQIHSNFGLQETSDFGSLLQKSTLYTEMSNNHPNMDDIVNYHL